MTLIRVGSYDRIVAASIERAWENVRDWEHLPWLHRTSFASIDLAEQSRDGWRAHIGLPNGKDILLELVIDGDRYVSRTLEGQGAGTEIWTHLEARPDDTTAIQVSFELPGLHNEAPSRIERLGQAYLGLYTRLWDEDEAMMVERTAALDRQARAAPTRLDLGPRDQLRLPLDIEAGGIRLRVLELDGNLVVHSRTCPHWLGPLEPSDDPHRLQCPWHGYAYDLESGRSCDGRGLRLPAPPRLITEPASGNVVLDSSS